MRARSISFNNRCFYLLWIFFLSSSFLLLSIWKSGICDAMWYVFIYKHYVSTIVWFDASCCVCLWYEIAYHVNKCMCAVALFFLFVCEFSFKVLLRVFFDSFIWFLIAFYLKLEYELFQLLSLLLLCYSHTYTLTWVCVHLHKKQITIIWTSMGL